MTARLPPPAPPPATAVAAFREARGLDPFGPFTTLLHHPPLMARLEALGRTIRYDGALAADVREAAILVTAQAWAQPVEWAIHLPLARAADVSDGTVAAIEHGVDAAHAPAPQAAAIRLVRELHATRAVSDATFAAAAEILGPAGLIELAVLAGYYSTLAMVMNLAGTEH